MQTKHRSIWLDTTNPTNYPTLREDVKTDILIIGGGLVGIILGYFLKKQGINFRIVELHRIGSGVTGHSTAKITSQHSLFYSELAKKFGQEKASLYADANTKAIDLYKQIISELEIDCDFKEMPNYVYTLNSNETGDIEEEVRLTQQLGMQTAYEMCEWLPFQVKAAISTKNQARFHPVKFVQALARYINKDDNRIFEHSPVRSLDYKSGPLVAKTDNGKIEAKVVVFATNYPFIDPDEYFMKLVPRQSYSIAASIGFKMPLGMYISNEKDFHSFRPQIFNGKEIWLFGGGPQFVGRVKDTPDKYIQLKKWARDNFDTKDVYYCWTTHDLKTFDGIPIVGQIDKEYPHIFIATGFKGWGVTNTMAAAKLLSDEILQKQNDWSELYKPQRTGTIYSKELFSYNVPTVARLVAENIKNYPEAFADLPAGEGDIFEVEGKKLAVYRDENEQIHSLSAKCTHMGCVPHFNKAEISWDCPCHGSRFDINGEIIHSPASKKLGS